MTNQQQIITRNNTTRHTAIADPTVSISGYIVNRLSFVSVSVLGK